MYAVVVAILTGEAGVLLLPVRGVSVAAGGAVVTVPTLADAGPLPETPASPPTVAAMAITCPYCGRTSHHPQDEANRYCGSCHWWTSDPESAPLRPPPAEVRAAFSSLEIGGNWEGGTVDAGGVRWYHAPHEGWRPELRHRPTTFSDAPNG